MTTTAPTQNRFATGKSGSSGGKGASDKAAAEGGADEAKKKSVFKSKKFIMIVVAVLAIGGIGYKMFAPKPVVPPTGGEVVAIDPTLLNLQDGSYLKVAISIQVVKGKATAADFMKDKAAQLMIEEFSDRNAASLLSGAKRKTLFADLKKKIKDAYDGEVFDVFYTQFVTSG
ncbi:MAG TPA: flagellar basal body-associated FliL family protein [Jatrophihabitans sp.]|nr:flagellar basal body-associated FliL family protein [Jatrophihabitans sp.]